MAHKAKDGTEYTNRMMANRHNASLDAKEPAPKEHSKTMPSQDNQSEQPSDNPEADQHTDAMLNMGMTPDDIHEHAKKRAGHHSAPARSAPSQPAQLSSIPGM